MGVSTSVQARTNTYGHALVVKVDLNGKVVPDVGGKVGLEQQSGLLPVRSREQSQRLGLLARRLVVAGRAGAERPHMAHEVGRFKERHLIFAPASVADSRFPCQCR